MKKSRFGKRDCKQSDNKSGRLLEIDTNNAQCCGAKHGHAVRNRHRPGVVERRKQAARSKLGVKGEACENSDQAKGHRPPQRGGQLRSRRPDRPEHHHRNGQCRRHTPAAQLKNPIEAQPRVRAGGLREVALETDIAATFPQQRQPPKHGQQRRIIGKRVRAEPARDQDRGGDRQHEADRPEHKIGPCGADN